MLMDCHSVMGGAAIPIAPTAAKLALRSVIEFPLLLLTDFLRTAVCVVALVVVTCLIHRGTRGISSGLWDGLRWARQRYRGILNASLAMIGLFLLKLLVGLAGVALLTSRPRWQDSPFWHFQAIDWILNLALFTLAIYLVAPWMLGLAKEDSSPSFTRREILSARVAFVLAIIGWVALQYSWSHVLSGLLRPDTAHLDLLETLSPHSANGRLWFFAVSLVSPILTAFWLTLLSVGLAVIAQQKPDDVQREDLRPNHSGSG